MGPAVPPISKVGLPGGRPDPAIRADHERIKLVGAARHGADERALRRRHAADAPPSVPPIREVRLPCRRPDSAVGTDDEDIEFVEAARYGGDRSAGRRAATVQFPPPVPAIGKIGFPGRRLDHAVDVGDENVQLVWTTRNRADHRTGRYADIADRPPAVPPISKARLPCGGVYPAVGSDHERIELVGIARNDRDMAPERGDASV